MEEFLPYLNIWEKSVSFREGFKNSQKKMMLLSQQTRQGLRMTGANAFINNFYFMVRSFVELVQYLFSLNDVTVFLSNRLCHDPLEKFFGQQRQRGKGE